MLEDNVRPGLTTAARVLALDAQDAREIVDDLATEEPLEIRMRSRTTTRSVAITMRTPGNDFELAAGFLAGEQIIGTLEEVSAITYCIDPDVDQAQRYNIVNVDLAGASDAPLERLERHFTMNSACGVCGKASIEALQLRTPPIQDDLQIDHAFITALPQKMRDAQRVFSSTGGLHAAALFDANGTLLALREDVGRHNALDKIVGWALLNGRLPLNTCVLLVSGRASYELVQKSVVARIPIVCAVSAPSSLAVDLARELGLTLVGFVRGARANVYTGRERIARSKS